MIFPLSNVNLNEMASVVCFLISFLMRGAKLPRLKFYKLFFCLFIRNTLVYNNFKASRVWMCTNSQHFLGVRRYCNVDWRRQVSLTNLMTWIIWEQYFFHKSKLNWNLIPKLCCSKSIFKCQWNQLIIYFHELAPSQIPYLLIYINRFSSICGPVPLEVNMVQSQETLWRLTDFRHNVAQYRQK